MNNLSKSFGGKICAIFLLLVVFAVMISAVALLLHTMQQRQQFYFDGNTFSLVSVDRASGQNMTLQDQHGNILTFTASGATFRASYLDRTFSVRHSLYLRNYTFSDGSRGDNSAQQRTEPWQVALPHIHGVHSVGLVPHFNDMQQAESVALATFVDFYQNYTPTDYFVAIVIFSLVFWLACLIATFFHETFRPFKRVWHAELEDARRARHGGGVSVPFLIFEFIVMFTISVVMLIIF